MLGIMSCHSMLVILRMQHNVLSSVFSTMTANPKRRGGNDESVGNRMNVIDRVHKKSTVFSEREVSDQ